MDPEATLDQAEQALDDGDLETAIDRFEDYHQWRRRGGFAPSGGDARAKRLEAKLLKAHGKGLTGRRGKRLRGLGRVCADAKREAERAIRAAKTPAQRRAAEKFAARVSERCAVDLRGMTKRRKRARR